jgi:hypothetical protein
VHITLTDGTTVELEAVLNPVETTVRSMLKHLQHVPLPFRPWDNAYYQDSISYNELVDQLDVFASKLEIKIEKHRCLDRDDDYFNALHKIYESNYNGDPKWLDYHETIHLCQRYFYTAKKKVTTLDWREKAGPLIKDFDPQWAKYGTTKIKKGDVYVEWNELGKTPYMYWIEKEPNSIARINELVKPWSKLRPKLTIAMHDTEVLPGYQVIEFLDWWKEYQEQWCKQHDLSKWTIEDMSCIVVYRISNFDQFDSALKQQNYPVKISL